MNSLSWNPVSPSAPEGSPSTRAASQGPWFAVTLALVGVIAGFTIGKNVQGRAVVPPASAPTPTAAAPSPTPAAPEAPAVNAQLSPVDLAKDHIRGDRNANIAVVTYSDYQCPYCKRVHPTLQQVLSTYPGKVMLVFRHYPLSFHPQALPLARASECVAESAGNDAFWKYTDTVFDTLDLTVADVAQEIRKAAIEAGAAASQYDTCIASGKFDTKINAEEQAGSAAGVSGTPGSFIVNLTTKESVPISGAVPFEQFKTTIDSML